MLHLLAIESSCDDTAAAVLTDGRVAASVVNVQTAHGAQGGIVPELASRLHQQKIVHVVRQALAEAHVAPADLAAIACTGGPGLMGALLVGVSFAKGYAWALQKPLIMVDHLHGHLMSVFGQPEAPPAYPFLCLIVSGGHTQLLQVDGPLQYQVLGRTLDDAAGEAFDKTARLLGFDYPGGPALDALAETGDPAFHSFPLPLAGTWDFSFSGLKTSVLYYLQKQQAQDPRFIDTHRAHLCASIRQVIVQALVQRLQQAAAHTGITRLAVVGGVAANRGLRTQLAALCARNGWQLHIPPLSYCTDNAAMIALAAQALYDQGRFADQTFVPYAQHLH
jgi:N6-L-threonylcarbamoyladenine synthase